MNKRLLELLGMLMLGDGILTLTDPKRHCLLWEIGPKPCREFVDEFVRHPTMSRWLGLGEALLGLWLSSKQEPGLLKRTSAPLL